MKKIQKIREFHFKSQNGRCYYCDQPMWRQEPHRFAQLFGISARQAKFLQVTAEHLVPRSEGGADCKENIVAACYFCNNKRHHARQPLTPEQHRQKIRTRLKRGRWHGLQLNAPKMCALEI